MLVGAFHFPTDYGIEIGELARALEARGFESLFVCEHTHIPISRRSPYPGGGELPKRYSHTHDPFVALSFAAAATRTLKLGTGIALVPQRDPIVTAKSVASLDQLSGGRFMFAIGGGWNVEEMENHGTRYKTRFKLLRERVLAMKALWTQDQAEFHGQFDQRPHATRNNSCHQPSELVTDDPSSPLGRGCSRRAYSIAFGPIGTIAAFEASGIGRIAAKSVSPATAKPGPPREPRRNVPLAMRRRAGPACFV